MFPLRDLCRYQNCFPVLATLHRQHGSKFVSLAHATGASQVATRQALDQLIRIGLVAPNPGYGHPLRPEYILSAAGERVGPACAAIDAWVQRQDLRDVVLRRWSIPIIDDVSRQIDARFTAIVANLQPMTDRAAAMHLRALQAGGLIERRVVDGYPPQPRYRLAGLGDELRAMLADIPAVHA